MPGTVIQVRTELGDAIRSLKGRMARSLQLKESLVARHDDRVPFLDKYVHQQQGGAWLEYSLENLGGVLLADDVGLGKTPMSIAAIKMLTEGKQSLVLTQSTDRFQWKTEFEKFWPEAKVTIIDGTQAVREQQWDQGHSDVVLASHDILRRDVDFLPRNWKMVVRDEATAFKTTSSQRSTIARSLKAPYHLDLTGTPVETSLQELRAIMDVLQPGLLGTYRQFNMKYVDIDEWTGKVRGYRFADDLKARYDPFFLRRDDSVLDLPEGLTIPRHIEMRPDERLAYRKLTGEIIDSLDQAKSQLDVVQNIMQLRQFISHPPLLGYDKTGSKLEHFRALYHELREAGHKVVVFTWFVGTAEFLAREFNAPLAKGEMSAKQKNAVKEDFVNSDAPLLVTTDTFQKGKNLQAADVVIHYDPLFNPASIHQREGRIRRSGQERVQRFFQLILADTFDVDMYDLLESRQQLFDEFIDGEFPKMSVVKWKRLIASHG